MYDVSKTAYALVKGSNVTVCNSVQDVAAKSDFVVTMLPNNDIVYDTYDEITKGKVNSRTIFIDSSTIDPGVAKKVSVGTRHSCDILTVLISLRLLKLSYQSRFKN